MTVTIERCEAGARADAIQELFLRNDRPDFPAVYARAYRWWMERGASSWVGLDEAGQVVLHAAAFPRDFAHHGGRLRGGVLGDLMADPAHRNFWAPVQLLRRVVADVVAADAMDFLISDPTPPSAGILRAAGFQPLGAMRRLVLPLSPPYLAYGRWRSSARRFTVESLALGDPRADDLLRTLPSSAFRVMRSAGAVATRVPGEAYGPGEWSLVSDGRTPVALALLSASMPRLLQIVDLVWAPGRGMLASVVHTIARQARERGHGKLGVSVLERTQAAAELARAGFIERADVQPFVIRALRPDRTPPPVEDWWLSPLDGSAW